MVYAILTNVLVFIHFLFILFAVLGAWLILWKRWWQFLHLPAAIWVVYIEFSHGICPLTPLEMQLRSAAGLAGYSGGFVEHYIMPIVYPVGLTQEIQIYLGLIALALNILSYLLVFYLLKRRRLLRKSKMT
ncbi:MAG: DUF2784 domain-containing protein [Pseudomonadales bacterium]|nr:DUF2784 domain-containing protein [Pseudomonadales bacterium]